MCFSFHHDITMTDCDVNVNVNVNQFHVWQNLTIERKREMMRYIIRLPTANQLRHWLTFTTVVRRVEKKRIKEEREKEKKENSLLRHLAVSMTLHNCYTKSHASLFWHCG
jgi:hypothetical protein